MPSSSSSPYLPKYDVFLSFRGEDTRNNFTSHLYNALHRKQIETFIDNEELRRGDEISPSLSKAIRDSSIAIIVFSVNYATSSWCLNELLEILDCMTTKNQLVLPVFYGATPSDIRKQQGSYQRAFSEHQNRFSQDKIKSWRDGLTQVANLSGYDFTQHKGTESEFVEKIASEVLQRLNHMSSVDYLEGLVGLTTRMESIESLLSIEKKNIVLILGIWGMGGIGKTTLARAMLIRIANQFDSHCFLANLKDIAKYGPNYIQDKILNEIFEDGNVYMNAFTLNRLQRRKRVLIILDDVDDLDHIDFLLRGHNSVGEGSRIIITSRDKQVLKNIGVDELYRVKELNYDQSLELFSANAFKQTYPPPNYIELTNRVIGYAKGNPLALKVMGRFLYDRTNIEWRSSLNKLKRYPNLKIQNVLKISFDGLDNQEQEIFLSIACFFKGEYKDRVVELLNGRGLSAEIGLAVLVDKCLLTVTDDLLLMHDLIQQMGRGIVLQQAFDQKSWDPKDVFVLFKKSIRTDKTVESISVDVSQIRELQISSDSTFTNMNRLNFLKFYSSELYEDENAKLLEGIDSLPSNSNPVRIVELETNSDEVDHQVSNSSDEVESGRNEVSIEETEQHQHCNCFSFLFQRWN